ncbi:uncharacterized protein ARMOST_01439 [Armillaria ostoyae]|uniref:Uncharacterized protein n=1 Tax=Armillaria ostoyae TaxID=47428 RepID=A0A284QP06_ARMOS|nr:uncharacterized protein ARMOST_01439 [Armillaria ostoyae]
MIFHARALGISTSITRNASIMNAVSVWPPALELYSLPSFIHRDLEHRQSLRLNQVERGYCRVGGGSDNQRIQWHPEEFDDFTISRSSMPKALLLMEKYNQADPWMRIGSMSKKQQVPRG